MKNILLLILLFCTGITQAISQDFVKQMDAYANNGEYAKVDSIYTLAHTQIDYDTHPVEALDVDVTYAIYLDAQNKFPQSRLLIAQIRKEITKMRETIRDAKTLKRIQELEAMVTYELAYGLWLDNKIKEAKETADQAIEQSVALNDSSLMSEAYNLSGVIYRRLFMLDKAIASYQKTLKIAENQQNYNLASIIISNMSTLYNDMDENDKAIIISRKQFSYPLDTLSMKTHTNYLGRLCNHGIFLSNTHYYQAALDTFRIAEACLRENSPASIRFYLYTHHIKALQETGRIAESLQYCRKALRYRDLPQNPQNKANFDYLYGYILFHNTDSLIQAYRYAASATDFYRTADSLNILFSKSLLLLSEIEAQRNNLSTSASLAKEAYEKEIARQKDKYHKRLAGFQAELETQEKDLEISRLNEKRAIEKTGYQIRTYTIAGILVLVLLLSAILMIHMRKRKIAFRLKQMELEGEIKEKEAKSRLLASEMSKKMTEQYLKGLEDSNNRISKELHDGICNELLSIHMQINQSEQKQLSEQLTQIRKNVRNLSHQLSTPQFEHISLYDMLLLYTEKLNLLGSPQISSYISPEVKNVILLPEKILEVYRIIQEAVSNTIKHAHAQHMYLTTSRQDGQIEIIFEDDGVGFNVTLVEENELESGLGLRSIKERIHQLQGTIQIESQPGKGTILHIQFPV